MNFNAADALFIGFADQFIANENKGAVVQELATANYAAAAGEVVSSILQSFSDRSASAMPEGNIESRMAIINELMEGGGCAEVVNQFLSADFSEDAWMAKAQKSLAGGCPMTMHLVWEQLARGQSLSLAEVFRMEFIMVCVPRVLRHGS